MREEIVISILFRIFIWHLKLITDTVYGFDIFCAVAKLIPKLTDMGIDCAVATFKIITPHIVKELFSGKCQLAVYHQIVKQVIFTAGQLQFFAG